MQSDFTAQMWPHALRVSERTGVDPRVVVAQSALETGWGKSAPGNNFFGIKSHGTPGGQGLLTTEVINGNPVQVRDSFRQYDGMGQSADDYAAFLQQNPRYGEMLAAEDINAQIDALGRSGYATDPEYSNKIRSIAFGIDPTGISQGAPMKPTISAQNQRGQDFMPQGNYPTPEQMPQGQQVAQGLAMAFNQLRRSPDENMGRNFAVQNQQAQEGRNKNATVAWLRAQGRDDLAGAVKSGTVSGRDAFQMMQPGAPVEGTEINGRLVNPVTGEVMGDFSDAPETYRQVRGSELGLTGESADRLFNVGPDGKISQIGGSAPTITNNIGAGETEFDKTTGKKLAEEAATVVEQGSQAQRSIGQIDTLAGALESSPDGLIGALSNIASNLGIKTAGSSNLELANSIISQLVPQQRPPGSGVMSDADLELFKQSLPRLINTREGNQKIIATMRSIAEYDMQRGQIARALQLGQINPQQADEAYRSLGNPVAEFTRDAAPESGDGQRLRFNPKTGDFE